MAFLFLLHMYNQKDSLRLREEEEKGGLGRTPFRRDFGRLLHSPSFRRLQGKTQLFPGAESDFFRNRLTHSLEVAQIAKGIAQYLNATDARLSGANAIDVDLVEFAGLAHDLGHPPFGHNGERALDECMGTFGGFEGNAQTLRILTKVERKVYAESLERGCVHGISQDGKDERLGLNLTYRSLAAILKYDHEIKTWRAPEEHLEKGYYASEANVVAAIKAHVAPGHVGEFKTLECRIMDIADDIAYSTYDMEDAMKAGFTSPLDIVSRASHPRFMEKLREKVKGTFPDIKEEEILEALMDALDYDPVRTEVLDIYQESSLTAENSHLRTNFSSALVHQFMMGISLQPAENMALSKIQVKKDILLKIEVLKHMSYLSLIMSPRVKVVEYRGGDIVKQLFTTLSSKDGLHLLPKDVRIIVDCLKDDDEKKRVVCDFVAGMTDRYAVDFYNRLFGNAASLFVPI